MALSLLTYGTRRRELLLSLQMGKSLEGVSLSEAMAQNPKSARYF